MPRICLFSLFAELFYAPFPPTPLPKTILGKASPPSFKFLSSPVVAFVSHGSVPGTQSKGQQSSQRFWGGFMQLQICGILL